MRNGFSWFLVAILLSACGQEKESSCLVGDGWVVGGESGSELASDQVFRRNNGAEPGTLDPHRAEGVTASNVLRDIFEGLVAETANGEYTPGAAESWVISDDGKVYTFQIRSDARWSNGDPVTADDFVFSLRRSVDPKTLSNYSSMLYPIKNARDVVRGKMPSEELGVTALGPDVLQIKLEESTPYFIGMLSHSITYPVHPPSVELYGNQFTRPENLVSNGAFVLTEWKVQDYILVSRNK